MNKKRIGLMLVIFIIINLFPCFVFADNGTPITEVPLGTIVNFANQEWLVINSSEGKLLLAGHDGRMYWNTKGVGANNYEKSGIREYLNDDINGFLSKIPEDYRNYIREKTWYCGGNSDETGLSVQDKIGLIRHSEYSSLRESVLPRYGSGYGWWIITPFGNEYVYYVNSDGVVRNIRPDDGIYYCRPALYLAQGTCVLSDGTIAPPAPSLTANIVTGKDNQINITIKSNYVNSSLSYYLERATNPNFTENKVVLKNWVSSRIYNDTEVSADTTYYYRAKTKLNIIGNESDYSSVVQKTPIPGGVANLSVNTSVTEWHSTEGRIKAVLSWDNPGGATGYFVDIHDGQTWREFNLGNVTTWDSSEQNLYPNETTISAIDTNTRTEDIFYYNKGGLDLRDDPRNLYRSAQSDTYNNTKCYMFRIRPYGINGKEYYGPAVEIHSPVTSAVEGNPIINSVVTVDGSTRLTDTSVDLEISATASGSGLKGIYISDRPDMAGAVFYEWSEQGQNNGSMTLKHDIGYKSGGISLYVKAISMTNTESDEVCVLNLYAINDITPPVVNPTLNSGDEFATNSYLTLTIDAYDDYTNVNDLKIRYSFDGINWVPGHGLWDNFQFIKDINYFYPPENEVEIIRIFVQAKDAAGNIGNGHASIKYVNESKLQNERLLARQAQDTEKPRIISLGLTSGGSVSTNNRVNFSFGVEDNATLPENIRIYASANGVNWEDKGLYNGNINYNFYDRGYKSIYIKAIDEAGNYCIEGTRFFIL